MAIIEIRNNVLRVDGRQISFHSLDDTKRGVVGSGQTLADDLSDITVSGTDGAGKPFNIHFGPGQKLLDIDPLPDGK